MKKALFLSALLAAVWVMAMTGWSAAAHITGAPGPAQAANLMFDVGSAGLEAVELPRLLSRSRRAAMRHISTSRRVVLSALRMPERAGAMIADRWSAHHPAGDGSQLEVVAPNVNVHVHRPVLIRHGEEPIRIIVRSAESSKSSH